MWEALQQNRLNNYLQRNGSHPADYVYCISEMATPFVLNITPVGVDFVELDATCSLYVEITRLDFNTIKRITIRQGFVAKTITILGHDGYKATFTLAGNPEGAGWQKQHVLNMQQYLRAYFPYRQTSSIKKAIALLVVLPLMGIGLYSLFFRPAPDPDAWKTKDNSTMAYVMMQEFVKDELVSPGSAKFPYSYNNDPHVTVKKESEGHIYRISGYVDSQNAFGAILRNRYRGSIEQIDSTNWRLVALDFDN